jgi:HSP20 family protein
MNYSGRNFLNPWTDIDTLQSEVNRLFSGINRTAARNYPLVNIWGKEDALFVTAELPGYAAENIQITVTGNELKLSGERTPAKLTEKECCHRNERKFGRFERQIQLPYVIDSDKVEAEYINGILNLTLPRAEEDKPKNIKIRAK